MSPYNLKIYFAILLIFSFTHVDAQFVESKKTIIDISVTGVSDSDKMIINLFSNVYGAYGNETIPTNDDAIKLYKEFSSRHFQQKGHNGYYRFEWDNISTSQYANLSFSNQSSPKSKIFGDVFSIEPGDSILISEKNNGLVFSGKNKKKYALEYELYRIQLLPVTRNYPKNPKGIVRWYNQVDSLAFECLDLLNKNKAQIGLRAYILLKSNTIYHFQQLKLSYLETFVDYHFFDSEQPVIYSYLKNYKSPLWNNHVKLEFSNSEVLQHSLVYLDFLLMQYKYDSCFLVKKPFNAVTCYNYFTNHYRGSVREWLIYNIISTNNNDPHQNVKYCINNALGKNYIRNNSIKNYIENLRNSNISGVRAYNFLLRDTSGKVVQLSDFKGKIVLMDFWYVGCGPCIRLHPYLDSIKALFRGKKFELISICINSSKINNKQYKEGWLKAIASGRYTSNNNVNLFADRDSGKGSDIAVHYNILSCPTLILIDSRGNLLRRPVDPSEDKGHNLIKLIEQNLIVD